MISRSCRIAILASVGAVSLFGAALAVFLLVYGLVSLVEQHYGTSVMALGEAVLVTAIVGGLLYMTRRRHPRLVRS